MTPMLVLLFGVSPQTAVGTDLLYAAITRPPARSSTAGAIPWIGPSSAGWPMAASQPRS